MKILSTFTIMAMLAGFGVVGTTRSASAQVACPGAVIGGTANGVNLASETCLASVETTLLKSLTSQTSQAADSKATLSNIINQLNEQLKQNTDISSVVNGIGNQLASTMQNNVNAMGNMINRDTNINGYFDKYFTDYKQGQSFVAYLQQLHQNTLSAYQTAMGNTDLQVNNEQDVAKAMKVLMGSGTPKTQLAALQTLVKIASFQVSQTDNLIQVQSSMLKGMSAYWTYQLKQEQAQNAKNSSTEVSNQATTRMVTNPFILYAGGDGSQKPPAAATSTHNTH